VQSIPNYQAIRFRGLISLNSGIDLEHGVFKFVFDYHWRGWTTLNATTMVPVLEEIELPDREQTRMASSEIR
jgi:hypothetical protein